MSEIQLAQLIAKHPIIGLSNRAPELPQVLRCIDWLGTQSPDEWRGHHSGTMKHYVTEREDMWHASMVAAMLHLGWPVQQSGRYLQVC